MNGLAIGVSVGSALASLLAWVTYMATVPSGKVPARPIGGILLQASAIVLAIAGIVLSLRDGGRPGAAIIAPAAIGFVFGALFLWLLTQRKTPIGDIKVKVGDRLLPFSARASDGSQFESASLENQRILLKFFRGSW